MKFCLGSLFLPALLIASSACAQHATPTAPAAPHLRQAANPEPDQPESAKTPTTPPAPTTQSLLDTMRRRTLDAWWGGVFITRHGQPVFHRTYGLANESLKPFDEHTLFDLGDNSKQFTGAAVMLLVQQGKLSLDDPLSKFYPDAPEIIKTATIRQLLGHASGISDKTPTGSIEDFTSADQVARGIMASATRAPNAYLEYSHRAYNLVACIIEKVSGTPFDTFMRDQLFKPAGMRETGFLDAAGLNPDNAAIRVASGRQGNPGRDSLFLPAGAWDFRGRGAVGVVSCLGDMMAWEKTLATDSLLAKANRDQLYSIAMENYALGWYVQTTQRNTTRAWHGGASRGFVSLYFRLLEEEMSFFVITNENGEGDRIVQMLEDQFFPALPLDFRGQLYFDAMQRRTGGIEVEEDITWKIEPAGNGDQKLELRTKSFSNPIASFTISEGLARQMCGVLKDSLRTMPREVAQISKTTVNPGKLHFGDNYVVKFSDKARIELRSGYRTQNAAGEPFTDRRPLFAVIDPEAQNWPLMVQMDPKTAENFYTQLWDAVSGEDKKPKIVPQGTK